MKQEQVYALKHDDELHHGECIKTVGVRGGETLKQEFWRVNGQLKLWKRSPEKFELPLKHGLYNYGYLNPSNIGNFHLPSECTPTVVHKVPLPASENSKDKNKYKVTLPMICGGRKVRGVLERLIVSKTWLSNGHWMIKREHIASKLLREGSVDAIQARFLKYANVMEQEDEALERVIPSEWPLKASLKEVREKTFEHGTYRELAVFAYDNSKGEHLVGFNKLYVEGIQALKGKHDTAPWMTEDGHLIVMPHRL
jgi:hypothetical protein